MASLLHGVPPFLAPSLFHHSGLSPSQQETSSEKPLREVVVAEEKSPRCDGLSLALTTGAPDPEGRAALQPRRTSGTGPSQLLSTPNPTGSGEYMSKPLTYH